MLSPFNRTLFLFVAFATFCSCSNNQNDGASAHTSQQRNTIGEIDEHTAKNSLDWQGSYSGILPCADCEGIETELVLSDSMTYMLTESYMGKESGADHIARGKFIWQGNNIKLEGLAERPLLYKVEENRIRCLDMNGEQIGGELAYKYLLTKDGNPEIEDKRWQLVELNGKPIKSSSETHYIIFNSKDGKLITKAGCNVILNDYKIKNFFRLKVTQGITTLMACPDNTEEELMKALLQADNITYNGYSLSINKARMASLAVFHIVKG